jgi:hypothetical protein
MLMCHQSPKSARYAGRASFAKNGAGSLQCVALYTTPVTSALRLLAQKYVVLLWCVGGASGSALCRGVVLTFNDGVVRKVWFCKVKAAVFDACLLVDDRRHHRSFDWLGCGACHCAPSISGPVNSRLFAPAFTSPAAWRGRWALHSRGRRARRVWDSGRACRI